MPNICSCSVEAPNSVLRMICDEDGLVDFEKFIPLTNADPLDENESEKEAWGARMNSALHGYRITESSQVVYFSTAWVVPWILIKELSKANEGIPIDLSWEVEGGDSGYGCHRLVDGELVETDYVNSLRDEDAEELFFDAINSCNSEIGPSDVYRRLGEENLRPSFREDILVDGEKCFVVVYEYEPDYYCAYNMLGTKISEINPLCYSTKLVGLSDAGRQRSASAERLKELEKIQRMGFLKKAWCYLIGNPVTKQLSTLNRDYSNHADSAK